MKPNLMNAMNLWAATNDMPVRQLLGPNWYFKCWLVWPCVAVHRTMDTFTLPPVLHRNIFNTSVVHQFYGWGNGRGGVNNPAPLSFLWHSIKLFLVKCSIYMGNDIIKVMNRFWLGLMISIVFSHATRCSSIISTYFHIVDCSSSR
jgi:hypothetical protein